MLKVDYIIVGLGLVGLALSEKFEALGKSFVVFNDNSQQASIVAGGMYNPVVLKRFTPVYKGAEMLEEALPFYDKLAKKLNIKLDYKVPIARVFKSIAEQNNWFLASDKPILKDYMEDVLLSNNNPSIKAKFKLGFLKNTGRIDTKSLIGFYKEYLKKQDCLIEVSFDYELLKIENKSVSYKDITASKIVFCEGFGMHKNPFFNYLPLQESKGELLTIQAPNLNLEYFLKGPVFIMTLGNDLYKVGATFNWTYKTNNPTEKGKNELLEKLATLIKSDYKIVAHHAGVRPTVKDRRPLLGKHPKYKNMAIFNGLGTRGVMIAPYAVNYLIDHLEKDTDLPNDLVIYRF